MCRSACIIVSFLTQEFIPDREHVLQFDPTYLIYGGGISLILNVLLFRVVSPAVSACLVPSYEGLSKKERMEWNDRYSYIILLVICSYIYISISDMVI